MDLDFPGCRAHPDNRAPVVTLNVALEPLTWRNGPTWPGEGATGGGYPLGFIPIKPGKTYIFIGKVLGNHLEMVLRGYKEQIGSGDIAITWLDGGW